MINTIDDDDDALTLPFEERLAVEALAIVIIKFDSGGINEYDKMVSASCRRHYFSYSPKMFDLHLKNKATPPSHSSIVESL